jgi:hypothetical protein
MGVLLEGIKRYFETTPKDILDKEWEEKEYLDKIGPDVMEYVDYVRKNFGIDIMNKKIKQIENMKQEEKIRLNKLEKEDLINEIIILKGHIFNLKSQIRDLKKEIKKQKVLRYESK